MVFPIRGQLPEYPSWKTVAVVVGLFALAMGLVYSSSLGNEFVRWDDGMLIYENPAVREISPASLTYVFSTYDPELYIPLTFVSYQIDYVLGGTDPFMYHLTSALLHLANALLVAFVFYLLLGRPYLACFFGLVFLLHPLHTEAIAWASGRKDVLSTFFFLSAIVAYLFHQESRRQRSYVWSLVLFLLGLLSKVMVATLPLVLLLIDLLRGRPIDKKMFTEKVPYFVLSVIFGIIAYFGKQSLVASTALSTKILMACKSAVFYLGKILWPTHLSLLYPYTGEIRAGSPDFYVPLLVVIALAAACMLLWKRARWVGIGLLFFVLTAFPTFFNFSKGGEMDVYFASDRYAYVPSIGILLLVAAGVAWLLEHRADVAVRYGLGAVGGVILLVCTVLAYRQSLIWKDTETLFTNVIRHYPNASYVAYNNLGNMYQLRGEYERAIEKYEASLAVRPHAKTYSNQGATYRKMGRMTEALASFENAFALDSGSAAAHVGMGILAAEQGDLHKAATEYLAALQSDPGHEQARANLGSVFLQQGKTEEAVAELERALRDNPFLAPAWYNLGLAYSKQGDAEQAMGAYRQAIRYEPRSVAAYINLGLLLHKAGELDEAAKQFEMVLRIQPQNRAAQSALQQMGRR